MTNKISEEKVQPLNVIELTKDQRTWVDLRAGMAGMTEASAIRDLIQDEVDIAKEQGIM